MLLLQSPSHSPKNGDKVIMRLTLTEMEGLPWITSPIQAQGGISGIKRREKTRMRCKDFSQRRRNLFSQLKWGKDSYHG